MFSLDASAKAVEAKFELYRAMVRAMAMGQVNHLIVHGPPGIGKTYELEDLLKFYAARGQINYTRSAGHLTALSLYNLLYDNRGSSDVTVFDDCDEVFKDRTSMNILKAATDTRPERMISWESTSGKPHADRFDFKGRVAILTNADMTRSPHLAALVDRMFFVPLPLTTNERVARIVSVLVRPTGGQAPHPKADQVAAWIIMNHSKLGEKLTIRTGLKACELASFSPEWEALAEMTILGV